MFGDTHLTFIVNIDFMQILYLLTMCKSYMYANIAKKYYTEIHIKWFLHLFIGKL